MPKIVPDQVVFEAVVQSIIEHGYAGATTREIAERADINEATLFRKYGSKDELLEKAITFFIDELAFDSHVYYTGDLRADLMRILNVFFEAFGLNSKLFIILTAEVQRFPELKRIGEKPQQNILRIGQLIARYQSDGVIKQEHPIQAVASLLGPLALLIRLRDVHPELRLPLPDLETHLDAYLTGRLMKSD